MYLWLQQVCACLWFRRMREERFTSYTQYYPTFNFKSATFLTDTVCMFLDMFRVTKQAHIQPLTSNRKQQCWKGSKITVLGFNLRLNHVSHDNIPPSNLSVHIKWGKINQSQNSQSEEFPELPSLFNYCTGCGCIRFRIGCFMCICRSFSCFLLFLTELRLISQLIS